MRLLKIDRRGDASGGFVFAHATRRTTRRPIARHFSTPAVDGSGDKLHVLMLGARYALVVLWSRPAPDATALAGAARSGARP
jgi:hypothetical protein